ncbi:hypothetical protein K1X84_10975 [bacterium]|nr:hypothetical protein [bacterium]
MFNPAETNSGNPKVDALFCEFLGELNDYCTNGVVRKMDMPKVIILMQHFIEQCDHWEDRIDLEDRMRLFVGTKLQYAGAESSVEISESVEMSIKDKIRSIIAKNLNDAGKFAGFLLNWAIIKPAKILKTLMQPVVANTVLTYSIAVHPPQIDVQLFQPSQSVAQSHSEQTSVVENKRSYEALAIVKTYSEDDINNLSANLQSVRSERKNIVRNSIKKSVAKQEIVIRQTQTMANVQVDVERRIIKREIVSISKSKIADELLKESRATARKLRDIGDIQGVITQNDYKFMNSFQSIKNNSAVKTGRVAVKFTITPSGSPKDIEFIHNTFNEELANRIRIQLLQLRFSEVETKVGDQVVYHSFYF